MKFVNLVLILFSITANSFTLMQSSPPRYSTNNVEIKIANNDCTNIGKSAEDIKNIVSAAVGQFWNSVKTSRLKFTAGSYVDVAENASLTDMLAAIDNNQIIIGCSTNSSLFSSVNVLAVGTMTTGAVAKGVVAINNISGSEYANLSELNQRAALAHELGHAIGIAHSTNEYALMYYAFSEAIKREYLARDDADAITYLYPKESKLPLLLGACGQITDLSNQDLIFNLLFVLMIFALFILFFSKSKKIISAQLNDKNIGKVFH